MTMNAHARASIAGRWSDRLLAVLSLLSIPALGSAQQTDSLDLVEIRRGLHQKFSKIRADEYGNVHLQGTFSSRGSGGFLRVKRFEFWSRENKYFRIDEEILESSDPEQIGYGSRIIVRPEGMVQLERTANGWAVVQSGNGSDGRDRIQIEEFFGASTRCFSIIDAEVVFGPPGELELSNELSESLAEKYSVISATRQSDELLVTSKLLFEIEGAQKSVNYDVRFDLANGVLVNYTMLETKQQVTYRSFHVNKQYDYPTFKHIPVSIVIRKERNDGSTATDQYRIESVDWTPVSLGLFSLGAQGVASQSVWIRRALFLIIGLSLCAIYLVYRRRFSNE